MEEGGEFHFGSGEGGISDGRWFSHVSWRKLGSRIVAVLEDAERTALLF